MLLDIQSNLHLWPPFFIAGLVSLPFFFVSCFKQVFYIAMQTCFIPKKWCHTSRSISPYWPFSKRLLQLCSQLDSRFSFLQLLIQFKCMIFKQSLSFIHHWKDYLFMNYQRKNISRGYGFPSNARPNFFSGVLFPNCLLIWHSLLHNTTLFSPYQWL